jgi:phosphoglycolate phosphatase
MTSAPASHASAISGPSEAPVRLAIFDFDGTLADTFPWFIRVVNGVADRYGFERIEAHESDMLRGRGAREIVRHLRVPAWKLPLIARHMRRLAAEDPDAARLFEGTARMLQDLSSAGIRIAVVSSNAEENVRRALGPATAALVERYACGASIFGKASKFRRILKESGVAPAHAICIGDEIRDHEAASAAGIPFGAVAWGYTTAEALRRLGPERMFDSMDEIAGALVPRPGRPAPE